MMEAELRGSALRHHRLRHGLCPACGDEAAPYYLCGRCRFAQKIGRVLRRMEKAGGLERTKLDGRIARKMRDMELCRAVEFRPDPKEGDKRLEPRFGRIPVDVAVTLVGLLRERGSPATTEELVVAWGRLREKRRTASLAGDMAAIVAARRRREERGAKRAKRHRAAKRAPCPRQVKTPPEPA